MKVIKEFQGVVDGEVYPRTFVPGDVCPPELQEAGVALGAVDADEGANAGAAAGQAEAGTPDSAAVETVAEAAEPVEAPKAPAVREKKVKQ
jgi:hypothetical protein